MKNFRLASALVAAAAALVSASALAAPPAADDAIWRNPQDSVHVLVHSCGASRCGTVVWANDKAKADSARGGTPNLVGTDLFRDFQEVGSNVWKGKVFVPDLNRVFTGTGTVTDANTIVARGCLIGNLGCKSQTWSRVNAPAN